MMITTARSLFFVLATMTVAAAQEPQQDAADLILGRLRGADEHATEAVIRDLIRGGPANVEPLQQALLRSRTRDQVTPIPGRAELERHLERALAMCAVDAPVVDGIKVGLSLDRAQLAPGEKATLTVTLCNMTDEEIVLPSGWSPAGHDFANGTAIHRVMPNEDDPDHAIPARFMGGFCGTGAFSLVTAIRPFGCHQFHTEIVVGDTTVGARQPGVEPPPLQLRLGYFASLPLEDAEDGELRLQLRHVIEPKVLAAGGYRAEDPEPNWSGTLRSNTIVLRLAD